MHMDTILICFCVWLGSTSHSVVDSPKYENGMLMVNFTPASNGQEPKMTVQTGLASAVQMSFVRSIFSTEDGKKNVETGIDISLLL